LIKSNQINSEKYGILVCTSGINTPSNIEVKGNQILTAVDGIYSDKGSNFVVKNNVVNAQNYGIWLNDMQGTEATVKGNAVTSGSTPIYVGNAA
jgi:parallel beta-helix repeat protein